MFLSVQCYLCVYLLLWLSTSISLSSASRSPFQRPSFFLPATYPVKGDDKQAFHVRQVPGDGGCLFHSIATWISYIRLEKHVDFDWRLQYLSNRLRNIAVQILQEQNRTLFLEHDEVLDTTSLIEMVGEHYNMTGKEYCEAMLQSQTWGGGPEIVALCNHFKCPIFVYQLATQGYYADKQFCIELCAKFGYPTFANRSPLHILCADGRFPNIEPGEQKVVGDHFLALFPSDGLPLREGEEESGSGRDDFANYCHLRNCPEFQDDVLVSGKKGMDPSSPSR